MTIRELRQQLVERKQTSEQIVREHLQRIQTENDHYHAFISYNENALLEAKEWDTKEIGNKTDTFLAGIPLSIKDNIAVKGLPMTAGASCLAKQIPTKDAVLVQRLKNAGAIVLGKNNMHQLAYGTRGDRSDYGIMYNAHKESYIAGGSSGGSAVATARNQGVASIGTDTGGSIRIPASFAGLVGMKPTYNPTLLEGVQPLAATLDHVGPITKGLEDNQLLLEIMLNQPLPPALLKKKIGYSTATYFQAVDKEVQKAYEETLQCYQDAGFEVIEVHLPSMERVQQLFWETMQAEAYAMNQEVLSRYEKQLDEEVVERLLSGKDLLAASYIQVQKERQHLQQAFAQAIELVDALLVPTVPILPPKIEERVQWIDGKEQHTNRLLNKNTGIFNLLQVPALSVPVAWSLTGLPIGMQLIGNSYEEATLYKVGEIICRELAE